MNTRKAPATLFCFIILFFYSSTTCFSQIPINWANKINCDYGSDDFTTAIVGDVNGNLISVGSYQGTVDIDPSANKYYLSTRGGYDMYLVKYDSSGALLWAKSMGGAVGDIPSDVLTDAAGNIYITGSCSSLMDFDGSGDTAFIKPIGNAAASSIFLAKYDALGNLIWAKMMGGTGFGFGKKMKLDSNGDIILVGNFKVTVDFDPSAAVQNLSASGSNYYDVFLSKFTPAGNLVWVNRIGGGDYDEVNGLILDSNDNLCITGYMNQTVDFDPGPATYNLTQPVNNQAGFLAQYNNQGGFVWALLLGEAGSDVAIDAFGKLRVSGYTIINNLETAFLARYTLAGVFETSVTYSNSGSQKLFIGADSAIYMGGPLFNLGINSKQEIYLRKFSASGNTLYEKKFGSLNYDDELTNIYVQPNGKVFISGYFQNIVDFDTSPTTASNRTSFRLTSGFVASYQSNGDFNWASVVEDNPTSTTKSFTANHIDDAGNVYLSGSYKGAIGFDPYQNNQFFTTPSIYNNGFLAKYASNSALKWAITLSGNENKISDFAFDSNKNIYVTGFFQNIVDFDSSQDTAALVASGSLAKEIFLAKYDSLGNFLWVKQMGSTGNDEGRKIHFVNNKIYLAGVFEGTVDFNPGSGTNNLTVTGTKGFLAAFDINGNYLFAHSFVGEFNTITSGNGGQIYLSGSYTSSAPPDFDFGTATVNPTASSLATGFLAKYDSLLNYQWAVLTGSNSKCIVDSSGSIYLSGKTTIQNTRYYSSNATYTSIPIVASNLYHYCLAKYDPNGILTWVKSAHYAVGDIGSDFALDRSSNIYISGSLSDTVDFDLNAGSKIMIPFSVTNADAFLASYTASGDFNWVKTNPTFGIESFGLLSNYQDKLNIMVQNNEGLDLDFTGSNEFLIGESSYLAQYTLSCLSAPQITSVISNSVCGSGSLALGVNTTSGQANWYASPTSSTVLFTGNAFTTPNLTADKTYYVTIPSGACTAVRLPVTATVIPYPVVSNLSPYVSCTPATFTMYAATSAGTLNWHDAPVGGNLVGTGIPFTTPFLNSTTTYYLDATDRGCTSPARVAKVAQVSKIPTVLSTSNGSGCANQQILLTATVDTGNIQWQNASGTWLWSGSPYAYYGSSSTTVYVVGYIGSCQSAPIAVTATVSATPVISSSTPASKCGAGTVLLNATPNPTNASISWFAASIGGSSLGSGNSFTTPSISGTTTYYAQVARNGCTNSSRTAVTATINPFPQTAVNTVQNQLSAVQNGANYQWLNCAGPTQISGANAQNYTATANGDYAVIVNLNGCIDTSTCNNINSVGIFSINEESDFIVYPNPAKAMLQIKTTKQHASAIRIYDAQGKLLLLKLDYINNEFIDIANFPSGMYFVEVKHDKGSSFAKFIKS